VRGANEIIPSLAAEVRGRLRAEIQDLRELQQP
jgi:hypothetical protein